MRIFVSVVSHGHGEEIAKIDALSKMSHEIKVIVKNNKKDDVLMQYAKNSSIIILDHDYGLGFGENNNIVFNYCVKSLGMLDDDYFVVLNPDVLIDDVKIKMLCENMQSSNSELATVNLYKDEEYLIHDDCVRKFPSFGNFAFSLLGIGNSTIYEKDTLKNNQKVEWAAGSFLCFQSSRYHLINGFDEGYFMYCEDIDICFRSEKSGATLRFYKEIKAIHFAKHNNRKIFSKHFYWHVKSAIRFLLSKHNLVRFRSGILFRK